MSGTVVLYTPGANYLGSDSFTYSIADGRGRTATAVVSITVLPPPPHFAAVAASILADEDVQFPVTG